MFKSFLLELNISAVKTNYIFSVNSNDLNTIRLDLVIKDNAAIVDLTGKIVRLAIRKPDHTVVFQSGGVTDGPGGKCEFILSKQAALVAGRHEGEVMIYEGDSTVAVTTKFYYEVKRAVLSNSDVESSSDFPAISQAIAAGEILKEIDIHSVIEAGAIAGGVQEEMNLAKQKEDGTLFGTVQERLNDNDNKLSETTKFYNTVADMKAKTFPIGTIIKTLGYYSINDGGDCLYTVISTASKSYDIAGTGIAFRPIINGVIHPKMFGTYNNNGINLDNLGLQRCYDYAFDKGIQIIDGLNLLYVVGSINPYDPVNRGWSHMGAICKSGRKLVNFRFKTASGSTNGTNPLSIEMTDKAIYLENIEIDGNRLNLTMDDTNGREDGGCHGIHFYHRAIEAMNVSNYDFIKCGNIYMKDMNIHDLYSYGVRIDHLDCTLTLEDSVFDVYGIAVQAHTTTFKTNRVYVKMGTPRPGKVPDAFQEEIEFGNLYTGTKKQNMSFKDTTMESDSQYRSLFKVHYGTMVNVSWGKIEFDNCKVTGGQLYSLYNHTTTPMNIDEVVVIKPKKTVSTGLLTHTDATTTKSINIKKYLIDGADGVGVFHFTKVNIEKMKVMNTHFLTNGRLWFLGTFIDELLLNNCTNGVIDTTGIFRDIATKIKLFKIIDSEFTTNTADSVIFEATFDKIEANNLTINPNELGVHRKLFSVGGTKTEISMNNILLKGSSWQQYHYFIECLNVTDGYIYLNNVRHLTGLAQPAIWAANLPTARKIYNNVANLY